MRPFRTVLLAAVAGAALVGAAAAQTYGPPAPGVGAPPSREARRAEWAQRRQAHEAREVADLSTVLRLRPDQQAGLRAWLEAGHPAPGQRVDEGGRPGMQGAPMRRDRDAAPPTTAQTLDREAARMAERDTRMRARMDATRRFYASLGPDQQAAFDALERLRHGRGGGRHGGWGGRRMEGGGMRMGWRGHGPAGPDGAPPPTGD